MSIEKLSLRKLLQLISLPEKELTSALRTDIRAEIKKESGNGKGGGDFHVPFWTDAKKFAAGKADLSEEVDIRIASNWRRKRLYLGLRDGFLGWWNNKRRWINEDFKPLPEMVKGRFQSNSLNSTVKVENLLSLKIGDQSNRLIYPYFSEDPPLPDEAARVGLWLMGKTLAGYSIDDMRILDVLRGRSFSTLDVPLNGNEGALFEMNFKRVLSRWTELRKEYD